MASGSRSSGNENLHPAGRWLIPSIGDLIFIALLGMLALTTLSVRLLGDAGIGWHIRAGQLILATHAIPHVDPFSSTMAGQPWFAWEWLYDVLVGWLDKVGGLNAVVLLTAFIIALTFSWTFRLLLRRGANFLVALVLVLLAASAAMIHFFARPHVFSWLFTVAFFWILESSEKQSASPTEARQRWLLWLLPLLMLVWVNVHGGFLLGFALIGIYWLGAVWLWFRSKEDRFEEALQKIRAGKRARKLGLIGLASALATLLNPYGWNLQVHIYRYLSNRFLMDHIDEFQSPNFHGVAQKCFAILLLLTLIALATKSRVPSEVRVREVLLALFAIYSGLYASRNIPVSSLLLILVIGPRLSNALQTLAVNLEKRRASSKLRSTHPSFAPRMQAIESSLRGHIWPVAAIVFTCWIAFHDGNLGTRPLMNAHFDSKRFPDGTVTYLENHNSNAPIFAPDSWGGYLIYRLYPQTKVAVDDRHDFYGEQFLKSYLKMMHVEPGWEDFLDQHQARCVIAPKDSALSSILAETPSWQPIYSDEIATVFVRDR
jgi:AcrR family transcriptional regulator